MLVPLTSSRKCMSGGGGVFWGAAKFQVDVKEGEGGRGSDQNV